METCVLLRYQGAREFVNVPYEPENADYLRDMPGNASYREIKEWIQQEYGMMVSSLYVAQVKRKHGIIERENYNTGKGGHKVPQCPPEKEQAIEETLRYFRMT